LALEVRYFLGLPIAEQTVNVENNGTSGALSKEASLLSQTPTVLSIGVEEM
jgi:hypothetical protein